MIPDYTEHKTLCIVGVSKKYSCLLPQNSAVLHGNVAEQWGFIFIFMSKTRYIKTDFWSDSFIETLNPEEKLLFIYLFSNERVDLCWIYEITLKKISFESWIDLKKVESIIAKFSKKDKVYFIDWYIYIKNFVKHLQINPSVSLWIERSKNALPKAIIQAINSLGTACIQEGTLIPIPILELWLELKPSDISKDIWEQALVLQEEFWNKDINEVLEIIKWQVESLWLMYKKWKYERERAKNIITGKEFWEICERSNMSRIEFCKNIILISAKLTFWHWKINNAETLYKHYAQVYNDAKNKKSEMETPKRIFTSV